MRKLAMTTILTLASLFFTGWGIYLVITGDLTNGLLSMILGELVDRRFGKGMEE